MKNRHAFREIKLPAALAAGTLVLSALESLILEPHTVSLMAGYGLPLTAAAALALGIAALRRKRWHRLGALLAVVLVCIGCGLWLNALTACDCEEAMLEVFNRG